MIKRRVENLEKNTGSTRKIEFVWDLPERWYEDETFKAELIARREAYQKAGMVFNSKKLRWELPEVK